YGLATAVFLAINLLLLFFKDYLDVQTLSNVIIINLSGVEGALSLLYFGDAVSYHLWFLPALIISIGIVYVFQMFEKVSILLPASFLIHIVGVASQAYNIVSLPAQPRDFLFFGLFFVSAGFYISENNLGERFGSYMSLKFFFLATALHIAEGLFISSFYPVVNVPSLDYSFFTFLTSLTLFIYILSNPELGKGTILESYGGESLWIYILHPIFLFVPIASSRIITKIIGISVAESLVYQMLIAPIAFILTAEFVLKCKNV
ncbi:MAG: hypothetical protein V5A72_03555, partial [Candidatus Nanohaloarchaea archaeon]